MVSNNSESLTFEQALEELEILLKKTEEGDVPLDQMVDDFERGMQLIQKCEADLKSAELRIEQIKQSKDKLEPFESEPAATLFD